MMPRTPIGDLVAALVLFGAAAFLAYVSAREGELDVLNRRKTPVLFWLFWTTVCGGLTLVAVLLAWGAVVLLLDA